MSQSMKFNVPKKRFSMSEQEYNEEKVTLIMKLMTIKLLTLYIFAAFFL